MAKHHLVCTAQKLHRKNRQRHFNRIGEGIQRELERENKAKRLAKAQKAVKKARETAIENTRKDRVRLAKKETLGKKVTKKEEVKKVTKRTTRNGGTK